MEAPTIDKAEPDRLYRTSEVAMLLGCSISYVWRLIDRGDLRSIHVGRLARIPASNVRAYIAERVQAEHPDRG